MQFNWVDIFSIGLVATVGGIQFMRGIRDISRVFFETILLASSAVAAYRVMRFISSKTEIAPFVSYSVSFLVLAGLGILLAFVLSRFLPFDWGIFNYLFALLFAVACGWAVGHTVLRALYLALVPDNPRFLLALRRSWVASQLLYFGALIELLALLRFARYSNVPE